MPVIYGVPDVLPSPYTKIDIISGENITKGDLVSIVNNRAYKASATSLTYLPCVGIANQSVLANQSLEVILNGKFEGVSKVSDLTPDSFVFVSTINGKATTTPPTSPYYHQIIGIALNTQAIIINIVYTITKLE